MKAQAIVYESNTGYTRRYAELLAEATGLPLYPRKKAGALGSGTDIVYMGWIMAGAVQGYKKATGKYNVQALIAVGMAAPSQKAADDIVKRHQTGDLPVFYLQGGIDRTKLRGLNKVMLSNMPRLLESEAEKNPEKAEQNARIIEMIENGCDYVCRENLDEIVRWLND